MILSWNSLYASRLKGVAVLGGLWLGWAHAMAVGAAPAAPSNSVAAATLPRAPGVNVVIPTLYKGRAAFRLSQGAVEAIIVPALGRVMRYGFVGGPNFLWNAAPKEYKTGEWKNWGGDKTWPAPQDWWQVLSGQQWPPDPAWEGTPQRSQVLPNGHLRTVSDVSPNLGARVIRDYWFATNGDFVINQTAEKLRGEPVMLGLWSVTQVAPPDAIFLPLNAQSVYKDNFYWIAAPTKVSPVTRLNNTLLQTRSTPGDSYKVGVDTLTPAILIVKDGVAFLERAPASKGSYPDGATGGHGFPVELWNNGDAQAYYNELEMLSPLQVLRVGNRMNHTVHWSLHHLATQDVSDVRMRDEVERLLALPVSAEPPSTGVLNVSGPGQAKADDTDFRLAAAPNSKLTIGTMAIIPAQPIKTTAHAVRVAKFASTLFTATKTWKTLYIYVFSDKQAAQTFKEYQAEREGRALRPTDYLKLAALWPKVPVRYELRGGEETIAYPAQNPRRWWRE